jgi:uncharacterized protein (UPF0276 family)
VSSSGGERRAVPYLGHGVGLRVPHYGRALAGGLEVDWVEVISENFFGAGGRPRAVLEAVRRERPLVLHGVSLGVGSLDPPDPAYLSRLRQLCDDVEPAWVSDHVCWTRFEGRYAHELMPLPLTEEALGVAVENTQRAQEALARPLLLENVSSYVAFAASEMSEWEFLSELSRRSGCSLLLDVNNVLVSASNHGFEPQAFLAGLPPERVAQFHLANHARRDGYRFDDHRGPVPSEVWALFESACRRFGRVSSLVEWDEDIPAWERLVAERDEAARRAAAVSLGRHVTPLDIARPEPTPRVGPATRSRAELERVQRLFFRALTWPRGVRHFASVGDDQRRAELARTFAEPPEADASTRLEVYADAYFYRLLGAASELFPRLAYLSGPAPWHDLITDYVLAHPPCAPDLRRLGERLPGYLEHHRLGEERPSLAALATLELALARALDAGDAPPLRRDALAGLPAAAWPELCFRLVPSAELLRTAYDLESVAAACAAGQRERALDMPPAEQPLVLLVWRRGHAVQFRRLAPLEALALEQLQQGARFEQVCASLGEAGAGAEAIRAWLERWLDDELLCELPAASY